MQREAGTGPEAKLCIDGRNPNNLLSHCMPRVEHGKHQLYIIQMNSLWL